MLSGHEPAPAPITLPCGAKAIFDRRSGISYVCLDCLMVVGSIGMPSACADLQRPANPEKSHV
jgi:hypothetical protein